MFQEEQKNASTPTDAVDNGVRPSKLVAVCTYILYTLLTAISLAPAFALAGIGWCRRNNTENKQFIPIALHKTRPVTDP